MPRPLRVGSLLRRGYRGATARHIRGPRADWFLLARWPGADERGPGLCGRPTSPYGHGPCTPAANPDARLAHRQEEYEFLSGDFHDSFYLFFPPATTAATPRPVGETARGHLQRRGSIRWLGARLLRLPVCGPGQTTAFASPGRCDG